MKAAKNPMLAKSLTAVRKSRASGRFHIVSASDSKRQKPQRQVHAKRGAGKQRGPDVLLVALEQNRKIKSVKKVFRR